MDVISKDQVSEVETAIRTNDTSLVSIAERRLDKVFPIQNVQRHVKVIAAVDVGSTGCRVLLLEHGEGATVDLEGILNEDPFSIPSDFIMTDSKSGLRPASKRLLDSMVSHIVPHSMESTITKSLIVRGTLLDTTSLGVHSIGSSGSKVLTPNFYYNILDGIMYALVEKYEGKLPTNVEVTLSVALPPEDESQHNIDHLRKTLRKFTWAYATGPSCTLDFVNHIIKTEPEAQAEAFRSVGYGAEEGAYVVEHTIEAGGRSIGNSITRGGSAVDGTNKTLDFGGKTLVAYLTDRVNAAHGVKLTGRVATKALETGFYVLGKEHKVDIVPLIIAIKNEIAMRMALEIKAKCYDTQGLVSPMEVTDVTLSGGMFREGDYGYSLATPLIAELKKLMPHAKFEVVAENLIPLGLMIEAIIELGLDEKYDDESFRFSDSFAEEGSSLPPNAGTVATDTELPTALQSDDAFGQAFGEAAATSEESDSSQAEEASRVFELE